MPDVTFLLQGERLMLQNNQTANPRNKYARRLKELNTKKKGKTADVDAILDQMALVEFEACLYLNDKGKVVIPAENIRAALIEGAKLSKGGAACKRYCSVMRDAVLEYDGPKTLKGLLKDDRFHYESLVKVNGKMIPKTRAVFYDWSAEITITYMQDEMDEAAIVKYITDAGMYTGIGASRGWGWGRFDVSVADGNGKYRMNSAAAK
jgi:hypothetical protein